MEMTTMNRPRERGPTAETSFVERPQPRRILTAEDMVTREVEEEFPNVDKSKLEMRYMLSKRTGLAEEGAIIEVKMRNKEKWYPLYTKTSGDTNKTFNKSLPKEIKGLSGNGQFCFSKMRKK